MRFSNALPVQFWLTGCATFNEHHSPGVHHKCWCAPWECDDEIRIQFTDDPSQNFSLQIYDLEEQLLGAFEIEETQVGVYELILNLSEDSPDVCDQLIELRVVREAGMQGTPAPDLSTWANAGGSGDPWTTGSNPSINTASGIGTTSEVLFVDYAFIVGLEYRISVNFSTANNSVGLLGVQILNGSNVIQFSNDTSGFGTGAATSDVLSFIATADTTRIGISVTSGVSANTITITGVTILRQVGEDTVVAHTDCLDVKENHEETILVTYSNHRNIAGLVYENVSPNTEFQIRIPAIFFHQRFPEEDEVMQSEDELITLNSTLRKQRRMDVDYVPYYFHEKINLILMHQHISIFNREWVKQEAYAITEGNRLSPLKMARCWLSEKEFVHRNVL